MRAMALQESANGTSPSPYRGRSPVGNSGTIARGAKMRLVNATQVKTRPTAASIAPFARNHRRSVRSLGHLNAKYDRRTARTTHAWTLGTSVSTSLLTGCGNW